MTENRLLQDEIVWPLFGELCANIRESRTPNMSRYHMHSHYEISMILSGEVTVLMPDRIQSGKEVRVLLHRPFSPHYVIPEPQPLYKRINVSFSERFAAEYTDGWSQLLGCFPANGGIVFPDEEQARMLEQLLTALTEETDALRCRLLLFLALSRLRDMQGNDTAIPKRPPAYIPDALRFIGEHYNEKIVAEHLASALGVSRTTLMTGFRRYVGMSLHRYQLQVRVRQAYILTANGMSVSEAASACGFCDIGGYIRAHRSIYGTTPTGKQ